MAEVTGFTADRMRVIENTTVVDGEVQGDNLILVTREGTPIDAGNVRGPQGIQGVAGPVQSVNDQLGAVYAPRFFPTKAALDTGWPTAPNGSMAITLQDQGSWLRVGGAWQSAPPPHIFPTKAALDAGWPAATAPEGAIAITLDTKSFWQKDSVGWFTADGLRIFPDKDTLHTRWPKAPEGSIAEAPVGVFWMMHGGFWLARPVGTAINHLRYIYAGSYIDQSWTQNIVDDTVWPVQSIARVTIDGYSSGWAEGFSPSCDLWSDSYNNPWIPGWGHPYAHGKGEPNSYWNVPAGGQQPQNLPSLVGVQMIPPGQTITWRYSIMAHNVAGAISWNGGCVALTERFPFDAV